MFETNNNKGLKYTSIFFDKLQFEFIGTRHGDSNEYGRILRKIREWDCFDFMRDSEEFKAFENRIKEKADNLCLWYWHATIFIVTEIMLNHKTAK